MFLKTSIQKPTKTCKALKFEWQCSNEWGVGNRKSLLQGK